MTPAELSAAAAALVERTTDAQALPRLVTDTRLLDRAAAMLTPVPEARGCRGRKRAGSKRAA